LSERGLVTAGAAQTQELDNDRGGNMAYIQDDAEVDSVDSLICTCGFGLVDLSLFLYQSHSFTPSLIDKIMDSRV
jgi:hypothetical protein